MGYIQSLPLWINDRINTLTDIRSAIERLEQEEETKNHQIELVVINNFRFIESDASTKKERFDQQFRILSRDLKILARQLHIVLLVVCPLANTIKSKQERIPQLMHLRETGANNGDADVVLFTYRDDQANPESEQKNILDVTVAKNNFGAIGEIPLYCRPYNAEIIELQVSTPDENKEP